MILQDIYFWTFTVQILLIVNEEFFVLKKKNSKIIFGLFDGILICDGQNDSFGIFLVYFSSKSFARIKCTKKVLTANKHESWMLSNSITNEKILSNNENDKRKCLRKNNFHM